MHSRDFSLFESGPWRAIRPDVLGPARDVPTTLSLEEQRLVFWLARDWADGSGALVDLGAFAGGTSARLAEGQRQAERRAGRRAKVFAHDHFRVDEATLRQHLGAVANGSSDLEQIAARLLAPWGSQVALVAGDLRDSAWEHGPIDILVVDAAKTAQTLDAIAETFFPSLRPGSIVVQVGALRWREPWVLAQMKLLAPCFAPLAHVHDTTIVYGCTTTPDGDNIAQARTSNLRDRALGAVLRSARPDLAAFGAEDALGDVLQAVAASPGVREAWHMNQE